MLVRGRERDRETGRVSGSAESRRDQETRQSQTRTTFTREAFAAVGTTHLALLGLALAGFGQGGIPIWSGFWRAKGERGFAAAGGGPVCQ
jgi:hypothetical protein